MISSIAGTLANPIFTAVVCAVFLIVFLVFFIKRKTLSPGQKAIFVVLALVCLAYFLFILWLTMGFGGSGTPGLGKPSPIPM